MPLLEDGDIVVDGGNSNFRDSQRRAEVAGAKSIHFLDAGVSGGVWGLEEGYCIMVGGDGEGFALIEPFVRDLAQDGGYAHVGASGAGHFVKMVHNGIEYGMMQSLGEGFEIMRASELDLDLGSWPTSGSTARSSAAGCSSCSSGRSRRIPTSPASAATSRTRARAAGRWRRRSTSACPAPTIALALFSRFASRQDESFAAKVNAALRNQFGGHAVQSADKPE